MPVPAPCPPHAAPRDPTLWPPGNPILRGVWAWGHVTAAKALGLRTPAAVHSPPAVPAPQSGARAHGAEAGRARAGPGRGHRALPGGAAQVRLHVLRDPEGAGRHRRPDGPARVQRAGPGAHQAQEAAEPGEGLPQPPGAAPRAAHEPQKLGSPDSTPHRRGLGVDSKPELQRVLEHRRRNQLIKKKKEELEAKRLQCPFEQELLRRQQRLNQLEKPPEKEEDHAPEFIKVRENLRRIATLTSEERAL
nr:actin-associated protein FAM107A isoform X1 [Manis javanica]